MNITGIIAEYNPFHNGHAHQLTRARTETDADYIIIVMSGNFVQRGAPALLDKYTRTKMALLEGADLVIELPALWSSASAEYFAGAGVSLLNRLGCVDTLCYGCETPPGQTASQNVYEKLLWFFENETPQYKKQLSDALTSGASYAQARQNALLSMLPDCDQAIAMEILKNPNNILALEYQKALAKISSPIRVHPVLRQGEGYHSSHLSGSFASASAIRRFLASRPAAKNGFSWQQAPLKHAMPASALRLLLEYERSYPLLYENDCSHMLHYCLLSHAADGFAGYADCTPDLSNRILKHLGGYTGFSGFCTLLKSKNLAYTRVSRMLTHILLDIRQSDYAYWRSHSYMPYAKVLGFRKDARSLLTHLKKQTSVPLLTRAADARNILTAPDDKAFFQKQVFADAVYEAMALEKSGRNITQRHRQQIVIV
ncbi:MAG: nucleotidyltransferase family protein [Eubacterium sp.]|nr:nucleotidyltransferase family protein [Eubacterium sp.]